MARKRKRPAYQPLPAIKPEPERRPSAPPPQPPQLEEEVEDPEEENPTEDDEEEDGDQESEDDEEGKSDDDDDEESDDDDDDEIYEDDDDDVKEQKIRKLLAPFSKDALVKILIEASKSDASLVPDLLRTVESDPIHRNIFVYGLAFHVTNEMLTAAFLQYGPIESACVVGESSTGKSKGYGFVLFKTRAAARKALRDRQKNIGGKICSFQLAALGAPQTSSGGSGSAVALKPVAPSTDDGSYRKLYVANVRPELDREKVKEFFEQFGEIETGPVGYDKSTGKFKGYAIIIYKSINGLKKALEQPIKVLQGTVIQCSKATKKNKPTGDAPSSIASESDSRTALTNYLAGARQGLGGQSSSQGGVTAVQNMMPGFVGQNPTQGTMGQNVNAGWIGQNQNHSTFLLPQNTGIGTFNPSFAGAGAPISAGAVAGSTAGAGGMVVGDGAAVATGVAVGAGVGLGMTRSFQGSTSTRSFPGSTPFPGAIPAGAFPGAVSAGSFPGSMTAGSLTGVLSAGSFMSAMTEISSMNATVGAGGLMGAGAGTAGATGVGVGAGVGLGMTPSFQGPTLARSFPGSTPFPGAISVGTFPGAVSAGSFPGSMTAGSLTGLLSAGSLPGAISAGIPSSISRSTEGVTQMGSEGGFSGHSGINTISPNVIGSYASRVGLRTLGPSSSLPRFS
ncbi:hypothetical protein Dimus_019605 [Dionaea muscipula]